MHIHITHRQNVAGGINIAHDEPLIATGTCMHYFVKFQGSWNKISPRYVRVYAILLCNKLECWCVNQSTFKSHFEKPPKRLKAGMHSILSRSFNDSKTSCEFEKGFS